MSSIRIIFAALALSVSLQFTSAAPVVLIPTNAFWKYLDNGSDQGTAWTAVAFDDSAWKSGPAILGYGEGDEATVVSYGPTSGNKYITTYFRRAFTVSPGMIDARLRLLRDDGAVVYVNGVEVRRDNMPSGPVAFNTLATLAVGIPDERTFFETIIPASAFAVGANVIAVEVHQVNPASSDLSFALELSANFGLPWPIITVTATDAEGREIPPWLDIPEDPAAFRISRTGATNNALTVAVLMSGTASNGVDYTLVPNSVTIPAGSESTDVFIEVIDDDLAEGTESVVLTVPPTPCMECYVVNTNSTATAFIRDSEPANSPPTVAIFMPEEGAKFTTPVDVLLRATAADVEDGNNIKVEFYEGANRIGSAVFFPTLCPSPYCPYWALTWSNVPAGNYTLTAKATDSVGAITISTPVHISVVSSNPPPTNTTLVAVGSVWRYDDTGRDLGDSWRGPVYDDTAWPSGPAELGYGDGDEATVVGFGPDPANKYITTYFRRGFDVVDASGVSNLVLRVLRDDGVVVYLNGVEVYRNNMPDGPVTYHTLASSAAVDESTFSTASISADALVSGANVIAAEVHQVNGTSSDISFDLELTASGHPGGTNRPPVVRIVSPTNNAAYTMPANVFGLVSLQDSDGLARLAIVEVFANSQSLGLAQLTDPGPLHDAAFRFTWSSPAPGEYSLRARATDEHGAIAFSAPVHVTINGPPTNHPPVVRLNAPQNGAVFIAPAQIRLEAYAQDAEDHFDVTVEFFAGTNRLGGGQWVPSTCPAPYCPYFTLTWSNVPPGSYSLTARATDRSGASSDSEPVNITVRAESPPGDRELHAIGIYSGVSPLGGASHNHEEGQASVVVDRPGKSVTLFLSSYEPVLWHISTTPGTVLEKIILGGYYCHRVDGVPAGVEVVPSCGALGPNGLYIGTTLNEAQFYRTVAQLCKITSQDISSFQGSGTAPYPTPFTIDSVQNDIRLRCDYPQPTPASELPQLSFRLAFYQGDISGDFFFRDYTLAGPREGRLLPAMRIVPDQGGRYYYGKQSQSVWKVDSQTATARPMELPPLLAQEGWPMGVTFDSQRERILVVSLGGEGYLHAYMPAQDQWSLVSTMNSLDLDSLVYHPGNDALYGLEVDYSGLPLLIRFDADGSRQGQIQLPVIAFSIAPGQYQSELVSVGEYLVLLLEPSYPNQQDAESRMYLIDPRSGQVWLTYRHIGLPHEPPPPSDTDHDGVTDDRDNCPNTAAGEIVDAHGCSIAQLCPCSGPWRNHADYVRCVIQHAWEFYREGRITAEQRREIQRNAVMSNCGRRLNEEERVCMHLLPLTPAECRQSGIRFLLSGDYTGGCVVESSVDLVHWTPEIIPAGSIDGTELACPMANDSPARFYRVRLASP